MGVSFDAPAGAAAAGPGARADARRSTSRHGGAWARAGVGSPSSSARSCWAPWSSRSPGSSWCCRSTAWRRCSSWTCPTRSATPGASDALAFLRETLEAKPEGDVAGIVAFGKDALVERLPVRARGASTGSPRRRSRARRTSAARSGSPTALFPDDAQKRIVLLATATTPPAAGRPRRRWPASRGVRIETRRDRPRRRRRGPHRAADDAVDRTPRRDGPGDRRDPVDRSPSRPRSGCSPTARWSPRSRSSSRRASPGSRSTSSPRRPASTRSGPSSRPPATPSARTTGPTPTRSSRASRGRWCSSANDRVASQLVAALREPAPAGRHDDPRGAADRPRGPRHLRQHRPRGRPTDAAQRPPAGRAPGLRPRPRQGAGHGRRARTATARAATRRRRSRRRCRWTWASATARSSRTSRSWSSSTSPARWPPATATPSTGATAGAGWPASRRWTSARRRSCGPRRP